MLLAISCKFTTFYLLWLHMCHATLGVVGFATNFTGEILLLLLFQMAAVYVLDNCGPILPYLLSFYLHIIIFLNLFDHPV